ncbi:cyclin-O [Stegastes partitus]|uniref:G2/mitotic-specific cyclin-B2 n=1 Tax=Stegastes partitus TaxID=144197 RepID=A0A9Y4KB79_9TELE|nr:PREDICTED: cyclin-O [Stegastes partitus]
MVSLVDGERESGRKKRRTNCASPPAAALTAAEQRRTDRHRKQTLMSRLSDSGFEEDLISFPAQADSSDEPETAAGHRSTWYLQYGDVGFRIQREKEAQFHLCESLAGQPQLTAEARCKLVSWLIPVHKHFRLSFECCCLAVNIMDRFLASMPVAADCFQLLGVTALLLASKQVEVCSPQISHLLSLCCDAFTKEQLCRLECLILLRLNFRLAAPTLAFFLDFYTNCIEAAQLGTETTSGDGFVGMNSDTRRPRRCSNLAQKVCELSLADYAFNKYPPSLTASCALTLASELLRNEQDPATLQFHQDQWDAPCTQPGSGQPSENSEPWEGDRLATKDRLLPAGEKSSNHNLAQECKDNLKLLVSLNQETLEAMSTM